MTSGGSSFVWTIDENGKYESTYQQSGREVKRRGSLLFRPDGTTEYRSEDGQSGTLTVNERESAPRQLVGSVSGGKTTFQMTQVEARSSENVSKQQGRMVASASFPWKDFVPVGPMNGEWRYEVSLITPGKGTIRYTAVLRYEGQASLEGRHAHRFSTVRLRSSGNVTRKVLFYLKAEEGFLLLGEEVSGESGTTGRRYRPPLLFLGDRSNPGFSVESTLHPLETTGGLTPYAVTSNGHRLRSGYGASRALRFIEDHIGFRRKQRNAMACAGHWSSQARDSIPSGIPDRGRACPVPAFGSKPR